MKKVLKNVSFVILLLKMCFIFGQESATQKTIIIDVGHGGKDTGAIGINGIQEKDVVMRVAKEILRLNELAEKPLDIYLTRYGDTLITLSDRTKLAKALEADLFVSLHCNHANNSEARGIEVYVSKVTSQYARNAIWLAFGWQAMFKEKLGFESRGVKFGNFQVLRETVDQCPSLLLEMGFLSNLDEHAYLSSNRNAKAIAQVILLTIMKY
ncbi:N-acetylmuramoyl-L-alanine amidase family protein [Gelidibacter maritimus]|uniref:N-acetylmuramoyl-L-alanine amidase n=1 Tax=Gelidibacter maritimus TaxID=2761487 RepID=A0A7W2R4H0_9FLAO|nr:N-acetylmuramoyl-L-alanine amidase [Gelidibacter maritimus]MBA6153085.1 N-acetylmuramoyl-L-alanine amidase [Gelidibacter maritimus]